MSTENQKLLLPEKVDDIKMVGKTNLLGTVWHIFAVMHEISRKRLNDPPNENNFSEPLPLLQSSQPEGRYMAGPCALEVQWHTCFHDTPFQGSVVCLRQSAPVSGIRLFPVVGSAAQVGSKKQAAALSLATPDKYHRVGLNHYRKSKICERSFLKFQKH